MYPPRLIEHFQNPRNVGELAPPAVTVEVSNPACGDILRLSARFEADVAVEVRYKVRGCTASIAAGSALTEWIKGKTLDQALAIRNTDIASELAVPLTSVRQPTREMGAAAADLLLDEDRGVQHVVFQPELVVRSSSIVG